jgi:hypothetical protein
LGEGTRRAGRHQPSCQTCLRGTALRGLGVGRAHPQPRHAVTHLTQRQAQAGAGRRAVVAVAFQRAFQDVALHFVQVSRQVRGQRLAGRQRRCGCRSHRSVQRHLRTVTQVVGHRVLQQFFGQAEFVTSDLRAARQGQRPVQQVFKLTHVARKAVAQQMLQRIGRQRGHGGDAASRATRSSTAAQMPGRSAMRSRSGGTAMRITLSR